MISSLPICRERGITLASWEKECTSCLEERLLPNAYSFDILPLDDDPRWERDADGEWRYNPTPMPEGCGDCIFNDGCDYEDHGCYSGSD